MKILIQILKITILSLVFAIAINLTYGFFSATAETKIIPSEMTQVKAYSNTNNLKFKTSERELLSNVGVALGVNIGTKFKQRTVNNLYQAVPIIGTTIGDKSFSNNTTLSKHMLVIREYYNLMRTDIKAMIDKAYDKTAILSSYRDQLEYRYKLAKNNVNTLTAKKTELIAIMTSSNTQIEALKIKINTDFKNFDEVATNANIKKYLQLKSDYTQARTYVIYINQYIKQYEFLNNYNAQVLDVLINNKDAIAKNTYVVIPDTGVTVLKDMNLIIPEEEYKAE